jgi:hypothetical protein
MTCGRGEKKNMTRVNVIYEIDQEYLFEEANNKYEIKTHNGKEKNIKISNKLFDLMKSEGLIQKVDDGYVFVGKYEEIMELKKKKN